MIENGATSILTILHSDDFTKSGYSNWKNSMEKKKGFRAHQKTNAHKEAVSRYIQHKLADSCTIDQQMDRLLRVQQAENRKMLLKILSNI